MANDWNEYKIDDLKSPVKGSIAMGPFGSRIKAENFVTEGVPIIKGGQLHGAYVSDSGFDFLTPEKAEDLKSSQAYRGDLVITHRGTIGQVSIIPHDSLYEKYIVSQSQLKVSFDRTKVNPYFVNYFFRSHLGQHRLLANASQVGVPAIAKASTSVKAIMIPCPSLEEQNKVVRYLKNLDDKIELNRQMNETLEAMAQVLFKSWFVDFDPVIDNALAAGNAIPDEFIERAEQRKGIEKKDHSDIQNLFPDEFEFTEEMGWIPKGWGVKKISDLVESVSITYPLKTVNEVIFLNTGDILAGEFLHKDYSDASGLPGQAKKSIKKDDILYSEIRPKNKRYAYVNFEADDYVVSTKLMVLRSVSSVKSLFSYFYLKQESVVLDLQYMAEDRSGTFPQITFDVLSQLTLTLPNETALVDYFTDQVLVPYHNKIHKNEESSKNLAKLRDVLLPKLMSGELRIPDAAALVDEAI